MELEQERDVLMEALERIVTVCHRDGDRIFSFIVLDIAQAALEKLRQAGDKNYDICEECHYNGGKHSYSCHHSGS